MKCNISKHSGQRLHFAVRSVSISPADTDHCPLKTTDSKEHPEEVLHFTVAVNQKSRSGDLMFNFLGSCGCN